MCTASCGTCLPKYGISQPGMPANQKIKRTMQQVASTVKYQTDNAADVATHSSHPHGTMPQVSSAKQKCNCLCCSGSNSSSSCTFIPHHSHPANTEHCQPHGMMQHPLQVSNADAWTTSSWRQTNHAHQLSVQQLLCVTLCQCGIVSVHSQENHEECGSAADRLSRPAASTHCC
jgi:hypothetical protein